MWDNACPLQSARDVGPRSKVRDGDVGDDSNNFSLPVRCTCSSHGRPYDPFWLILSALLIGVNGYRWKLHLPKDYFVTGPPPPPGEFVVSPLDPSSERGPCAPPRGPFLKICFFRYTRLHTSRVRALETASFTLEGAAATCEETAMDETMVVLLTHGARQVERALRRALHCPQQHSKLPAPHLLALVP